MTVDSAMIIGSGIGSLVTALLLSHQSNREITIFEKHDFFGGRLTYEREGEFKIDQGPTIVLLPDMLLDILEEGGIERGRIPIVPCDPMYTIRFADGTDYTKFSDLSLQLQEIRDKFPGNEAGFERFLTDMKVRFMEGKSKFLEKSFVNRRSFFTGKNLQTLMKLKAYQNVKRMMRSYFNDDKLIEAYTLQTLYIGGHPQQSPAMYSLVSYSEHEHGIWYMKGGYAHLVEIIVEELRSRGVNLVKNSPAEKLNIEKRRVKSVQVKGEEFPADQVILNGDFPLMDDLVDNNPFKKRKYIPSSGCLLLYIGLDKIYPSSTIHQFFMSDNFDHHMRQVFETKQVPDDPSFYTFHPSILDKSLAPSGSGVLYTLIPVPAGTTIDWKKQEHLIQHVIHQMESRGFPELRKHMKWMKVRSPEQAQRDGLYAGGSFGIAPTLLQSGVFRPQLQPYPVTNLFAVGASVHPGGGVPIVMQGAKLLADRIKASGRRQDHYKRGG
ncbi:phytoene desaturase family protein [Halobacillus rhizosphaerae]|uniref:phytoene desaturase family protein n=1 Tax=Halobacillus rhizosphaerae TaxID=3064889 RepID=UPI00398BA724